MVVAVASKTTVARNDECFGGVEEELPTLLSRHIYTTATPNFFAGTREVYAPAMQHKVTSARGSGISKAYAHMREGMNEDAGTGG
jgi:hypothetical protein